jgi:HD-GYP domain-containing protein (c-di-GMP phosphodiesterase class II)
VAEAWDDTATNRRQAASDRADRPQARDADDLVFNPHQTKRARDLLARLAGARRAVTFYPHGHAVVGENVTGLMNVIEQYHHEGVDVPLIFFEDEVLLGEQLLPQESVIFDQLIRDMAASGQTSVNFRMGLTAPELERALSVLAADSAGLEAKGGLEAAVKAADIPNVEIGTVAFARDSDEGEHHDSEDSNQSYQQALDAVREFSKHVKSEGHPSADEARVAVKSIVDNILGNRSAMLELSGLKNYDEYTFFHSVNVTILCVALGTLISTGRRFLNSLGVGALMHDVGKMTVELDVLNKPGALSSEEWEHMRMHPVYGAEVAATMRGLDRASIVVILEHHMRYDLDGYPERRPRRAQHLTSRIVAIADAYDAMTSKRPYAVTHLQDEAMETLAKNAGTAFDPVLVRMFTQMMGVYPPRSVVRLSGGEVGIVVKPTREIVSPVVRVIADADSNMIEPYDVDLSDSESAKGRRVEVCLDPEPMNIEVDDYLGRAENPFSA